MRRAALLAVCLGVAACGGGGPQPSPPHGGTPARHASVADACVRQADGDPAEMSLCLASHHIVVKDSVRGCVHDVRDKDQLIECLREAAR